MEEMEEVEVHFGKPAGRVEVTHSNYGTVNKNAVTISSDKGMVSLFFSYDTLVGVKRMGEPKVSENDWSVTTGKFLNELEPDKKARVPHAEVLKAASERLKKVVC
jgi:hypothetical protein